MEFFSIFVLLLVFIFAFAMAIFLIYLTVFSVAEEMYLHIFGKPFYIHFYIKPKTLTTSQEFVLKTEFAFYNRLSPRHQKYFRHRIAQFIKKHEFVGKDGFVLNDRSIVLISATAVMLTFGMRKYLFEALKVIVVYPDIYHSTITQAYHKGEYNPGLRVIVFSWKHFEEGIQSGNDNLNLGLHEFAHLLHYHSKAGEDISALLFKRMYNRISAFIAVPENRERIIASRYFRYYAYTNAFEFLAVLIEHYFETPQQFEMEFPELYHHISKMLNHRHT